MPSLQQNFDELRQRLKHGRGMNHASDDPVYYLVFPPEEMLTVKRSMKQWSAKLNLDGLDVHTFSMAETINDILQHNDLRDIWLESEQDDPLDFDSINKTLADALISGDVLLKRLESTIQSFATDNSAVLFITDLEALHPYMRVGSLEQRLQGKFAIPTIILYPGKRSGKTNLSFLGIYPEDGNYRSIHIGG